jgi:hypothetical protein
LPLPKKYTYFFRDRGWGVGDAGCGLPADLLDVLSAVALAEAEALAKVDALALLRVREAGVRLLVVADLLPASVFAIVCALLRLRNDL